MTTLLFSFLIFGILGWCLEILWTGLGSLFRGDFSMKATTGVWMFFIYGSAAFFGPVFTLLSAFPLILRGLIYVVIIFAVEFATGLGLRSFNACPWDYSNARMNVMGVIRLDYAPAWFAAGLLFEAAHGMVVAVL
ncbi:MAG: putative ABC transporter permease [Defluviitaleaceae bacterium]|nr:putative ABC transporter permease [Defluviitaleaceae bacterium]